MPKSYIKYPRTSAAVPWDIAALAKAYDWPTRFAEGGDIAIGELGGGWVQSDIDQFCKMIGMPVPTIVDHSVNGATNNGDPTDDASGEVALDIEAAAASYWVATGKAPTIHMYWAPNASASIQAATAQAAADGRDVFSWSWGTDEANTGRAACQSMEATVQDAISRGMVVLAAAGDNDSSDGGYTPANVDSPSSCPHVISCGGTRKVGAVFTPKDETVWNNNPGNTDGSGTGGGFSTIFTMPIWMSGAPHGGRMVPDVAANADPETGVEIVLNGKVIAIGGTSFVAPFYAGLIAACGKKRGLLRPDGIGPLLWSHHMAFNDITKGNNGLYRAKVGPDACTGLGSPIGSKIAALLAGLP
jgi:subtilase family serine protease